MTDETAETETIICLAGKLQRALCAVLNEDNAVPWIQLRAVLLGVAGMFASSVREVPGAQTVNYEEFNEAVTTVFHQQLRLALQVQADMTKAKHVMDTDLKINKPDETLN